MLAISTGIIVTRVFDGSPDTVSEGIFKELMAHEVVVYALGGLFMAMGIFTPLPFLPFALVGGGIIFLGIRNKKTHGKRKRSGNAKRIRNDSKR